MLLPMFGFLLSLVVIGGLASLVAIGDPINARVAPYIGFTALFAGLGALILSVSLTLLGEVLNSQLVVGFGFFGGSALGGFGGASFGLYRALQRRRRIESAQSSNVRPR